MDWRAILKLSWKIFNWGSLVLAVFTVLLVIKKPRPPDVPTDPQAAQSFKAKMKEVAEARSEHKPAELHLQPAEINAWLQTTVNQNQGNGVSDVKADLIDDRVRVYTMVPAYGMNLALMLEGRLGVRDGYLTIETTAGKLGSLSLPASTLNSAVERMFSTPENHDKMRMPPEITGLRVQNSEMVVSFK